MYSFLLYSYVQIGKKKAITTIRYHSYHNLHDYRISTKLELRKRKQRSDEKIPGYLRTQLEPDKNGSFQGCLQRYPALLCTYFWGMPLPQLGNVSPEVRWRSSGDSCPITCSDLNHFLNLGQFGARSFVFYSCFHMPAIVQFALCRVGRIGELPSDYLGTQNTEVIPVSPTRASAFSEQLPWYFSRLVVSLPANCD